MKLRLIAAACLAVITPPAAYAQDGLEWIYTRSVQPDVFDTFLQLSYAIPQTDAVQMTAECVIGNSGPYLSLMLFSDVSGQQDGAPADMTLTSAEGERFQRNGMVTGVNSEVGISGISVALFTDDPIWAAFRDGGTVYYDLPGQASVPLPMQGIGDKAEQLTNDCARIDTLFQGGDQTGAAPGDAEAQVDPVCAVSQNLRSVDGDRVLAMTVRNNSDGYRAIYWIDHNGGSTDYGALNPGETLQIDTREGHVWEFTDGPGNCIDIAVANADSPEVVLSRAAPFFGNE